MMPSHDPRVPCVKEPPGPVAPTFPDLLDSLYSQRYTGRVLLHFHNGVPRIVEIAHKTTRLRSIEP